MPVPISRPTGTKPWGPLGYLKDLISPPGYVARGPFGSRPASAATSSGRAPTDAELRAQGYGFGVHENDPLGQRSAGRAPTDAELQAQGFGFGVREYDPLERGSRPTQRALPAYAGATPAGARGIVQGVTAGGQVDRTQSDLYKQYALNPQGQFDRYFGTGEMDRYFGAASRGAGAPKDVAAMEALAGQTKAPTDTPLATYYRAQSAVGRAEMPEIIKELGYKEGSELAKWAQANPMLAQRLRAKQAKTPAEGAIAPVTGEQQKAAQEGYAAGAQPLDLGASFSVAANSVPGPWNQQGAMVDLNRGAPFLRAAQAEKTNPMNAFSQEMPIADRVRQYLQQR